VQSHLLLYIASTIWFHNAHHCLCWCIPYAIHALGSLLLGKNALQQLIPSFGRFPTFQKDKVLVEQRGHDLLQFTMFLDECTMAAAPALFMPG
jgi:hypothetical protein